jgi:hypothetical protein
MKSIIVSYFFQKCLRNIIRNGINSTLPAIIDIINVIFAKEDRFDISITVALCSPKNGPLLFILVSTALKALLKSRSEIDRANDMEIANDK